MVAHHKLRPNCIDHEAGRDWKAKARFSANCLLEVEFQEVLTTAEGCPQFTVSNFTKSSNRAPVKEHYSPLEGIKGMNISLAFLPFF